MISEVSFSQAIVHEPAWLGFGKAASQTRSLAFSSITAQKIQFPAPQVQLRSELAAPAHGHMVSLLALDAVSSRRLGAPTP